LQFAHNKLTDKYLVSKIVGLYQLNDLHWEYFKNY